MNDKTNNEELAQTASDTKSESQERPSEHMNPLNPGSVLRNFNALLLEPLKIELRRKIVLGINSTSYDGKLYLPVDVLTNEQGSKLIVYNHNNAKALVDVENITSIEFERFER